MYLSTLTSVVTVAGSIAIVSGETAYNLKTTYDASNFFDAFEFVEAHDDYTQGFAYYTSKDKAMKSGYSKIHDGKVFLGVDNSTKLSPDDPNGRNSVRLESIDTFDGGLIIADFEHLPGSACGSWPAFWTLHDEGSEYSEIDIIEGVSLNTANEITMYTSRSSPCELEPLGSAARRVTTNCFQTEEQMNGEPQGCGVVAPEGSFGSEFNKQNGGVWALQLEADRINAWHIPRAKIQKDITEGRPDPSTWGTPAMSYGPGTCDITKAWKAMKIVLNITFCGAMAGPEDAWAGYGDNSKSCALKTRHATCNEYVAKNPQSFSDTYFLINSVRVFDRYSVEDSQGNQDAEWRRR